MNLVDNIDFHFSLSRREVDFIAQVADIVYAGIRSGVDFDNIEKAIV